MSKTSASVLAAIVLASVAVLAFLICGSQIKANLDDDVFKLTYEFLLIVVIGGAVSLLYKRFSDERDRDRERRALLRQMHSELLHAYNAAKRGRRILRAHVNRGPDSGVASGQAVGVVEYEEQVNSVMDAQLTFEVYAKRAEAKLWFASGEKLAKNLRSIERYLNAIIDEYEDKRYSFAGTPPSKPLAELPKLAEFIGPYKAAKCFQEQFKYPFREALSALLEAGLT
jgi:hypothetical protein